MNKSEQINDLAAALVKAQGQMKHAAKDHSNPHFGSRYADLASVLDAVREPLAQNGLAVTQLVSSTPEAITITTMMLHTSGQWLSGELAIPLGKRDAQGVGSAATYGRRYALAAICGVAQDDDDGNDASKKAPSSKPAPQPTPTDEARLACFTELQRLGVGGTAKGEPRNNAMAAMVAKLNGAKAPKAADEWSAVLEKLKGMTPADVEEMARGGA